MGVSYMCDVGAAPITRFVAIGVSKIMPRQETTAVKVSSLVGKRGESSVMIDSKGGRAKVRDEHGSLHNIYCKTQDDEQISVNEEIIVLQYIKPEKAFIVKKAPNLTDVQK